jgi:quercetin dioxygenase-like cupin family protein
MPDWPEQSQQEDALEILEEEANHYVLGEMPPAEAARFELRLAASCRLCLDAVDRARDSATAVLVSAAGPAPGSGLRDRVLRDVPREAPPREPWQSFGNPPIRVRLLHLDQEARMATYLVLLPAGGGIPAHRHDRDEQCFVVAGALNWGGRDLKTGNFMVAPAGQVAPAIHTETGSLLLIVGPPDHFPS